MIKLVKIQDDRIISLLHYANSISNAVHCALHFSALGEMKISSSFTIGVRSSKFAVVTL
jgi:hypothetical protein